MKTLDAVWLWTHRLVITVAIAVMTMFLCGEVVRRNINFKRDVKEKIQAQRQDQVKRINDSFTGMMRCSWCGYRAHADVFDINHPCTRRNR